MALIQTTQRPRMFAAMRVRPPWWVLAPAVLATLVGVRSIQGQSLLEEPLPFVPAAPAAQAPTPSSPQTGAAPTPPSTPAPAAQQAPAPSGGLAAYSLFAVQPQQPKRWAKHDLVEVIINESSIQKFQQTNDLKKNYDFNAQLSQFPSLEALFTELALKNGIGSAKPAIGVGHDNKYKGEAKLDRTDQVTARITAEVIDVKPNGTLVLEAKESIQSDREISTLVLSGTCRSEDITRNNTILSAQLAGLNIRIEHEGDVKDTAEKGIIPRVLEAIFNF